MIDNAAQQTLDFIQYSLIFEELDSNSGERSGDKQQDENAAEKSRGSGGND